MSNITDSTQTLRDTLVLLDEPERAMVSIAQAAAILGIAKSTKHNFHRRFGNIIEGFPVSQVERVCFVSIANLGHPFRGPELN